MHRKKSLKNWDKHSIPYVVACFMYEMCSVHISSYELSSPFTPTSIRPESVQEKKSCSSKGSKTTSWCGIGKRIAWKQNRFPLLFSYGLPFCLFANFGKQLFSADRLRKKSAVIAVKGKAAILKMYYFSIIIFHCPPAPNYKTTAWHHAEVQRNKTNPNIFHCLTVLNKNYNTNVVSCTISSSSINEGTYNCILGRFD